MSIAELSEIWKPYTHRQWVRKKINKEKLATKMRRYPTPAEARAWTCIFQPINRLFPYFFRRQYLVYGYILDFYCHYKRLGIEIDGSIHRTQEQQTYDDNKDRNLSKQGIRILRFTNDQIFNTPEKVRETIMQYMTLV